MNSERVFGSLLKPPRIELVMANAFCCSTPRIIMQRWIASTTTATPLRLEHLLDRLGDLHGEALLHLEPAREHLDEPRDLREPDDAAVRDVGDVDAPEERQQVVLAEAVEVDVLARAPSRRS